MGLYLPKLDKTMPIVTAKWRDPATGKDMVVECTSTPRFQIFWQFQSVRLDGAATVNFSDETAAVSYDPAQIQRLIDFCAGLSRGLAG